jgi:hypothetical protein
MMVIYYPKWRKAMAYISNTVQFETECDAIEYVQNIRDRYENSASEVYINGPYFMKVAEVFKGMPWAQEGKTDYWSVSYEVFK